MQPNQNGHEKEFGKNQMLAANLDEDDVLDDLGEFDDDDTLDSITDIDSDSVQESKQHRAAELREMLTPEARLEADYARYPKGRSPSALHDAISSLNPAMVIYAAEQGDTLEEGTDVALLVARAISPRDLDQFSHQSAESISETLTALDQVNIKVDQEIDGKPAAHRVTEYYGLKIIDNFYDESPAAINGMKPEDENKRLAAFASHGVDFNARDASGKAPKDILVDMATSVANDHGEQPSQLLKHVDAEFSDVRRAAQTFKAQERAKETVSQAEKDKTRARLINKANDHYVF